MQDINDKGTFCVWGEGGIWKRSTFHLFVLKLKTVLKVNMLNWKKNKHRDNRIKMFARYKGRNQ